MHVLLVGSPREDPYVAGGIVHLLWSGNALRSHRTSKVSFLGFSPETVASVTQLQRSSRKWMDVSSGLGMRKFI